MTKKKEIRGKLGARVIKKNKNPFLNPDGSFDLIERFPSYKRKDYKKRKTDLENKISDILKNLSVNWDQISNYQDQWRKGEFYLDYINYKGREVSIEDIKDLIVEEINKSGR